MAPTSRVIQLVPVRSRADLTASRLAQGADAGFGAFAPDPVFRWLRPHPTRDHAERLRLYFEDRLRNVVIRRGKDLLVLAIRQDTSTPVETVLGWAIWERRLSRDTQAPDDEDYGWGTVQNNGNRDTNGDGDTNDDAIKRGPDLAEDALRLAAFGKAWDQAEIDIPKALQIHKSGDTLQGVNGNAANEEAAGDTPHMKLTFIAVHPEFQRQGIGRELVEWGCRKADRDGVPLVLGASPVGEGLYRKCGFEDLGVRLWVASNEDEAEYGRLNDNILVRWPQSLPTNS